MLASSGGRARTNVDLQETFGFIISPTQTLVACVPDGTLVLPQAFSNS